jgi:hypothetical protein
VQGVAAIFLSIQRLQGDEHLPAVIELHHDLWLPSRGHVAVSMRPRRPCAPVTVTTRAGAIAAPCSSVH